MQAIDGGRHSDLSPRVPPLDINMLGTNMSGAEIDPIPSLPGVQLGQGDPGETVSRKRKVAKSPLADFLKDFGITSAGVGLDDLFVKVKKFRRGWIGQRRWRLGSIWPGDMPCAFTRWGRSLCNLIAHDGHGEASRMPKWLSFLIDLRIL
jgi:hypothetical protein